MKLTYTDSGKSSGTKSGTGSDGRVPVVFLHGNPDCKEGWAETIELLAKDHRCIAPDLPGFGVSAELPSYRDLLPDRQAALLENLLDGLGIREPVLLVVHDLGAYMGSSLALLKPERVRGIIAANTTFSARYPGHLWGYLWTLPFAGPLFARAMRYGLKGAMARESPAVHTSHVERMIGNLGWTTCRSITRYYQVMYNPLFRIAQLFGGTPLDKEIPVRMLWGNEDRYIPARYARIKDEPVSYIDGCTHWLPLERPDLVADAVRGFLRKP